MTAGLLHAGAARRAINPPLGTRQTGFRLFGNPVQAVESDLTATAVVLQPLTGIGLAYVAGYSLLDSWIVASVALYIFVGLCWLPVLVFQTRMRDLAAEALRRSAPLPEAYDRLFRAWFILGWPAFAAMIAIFWLMIARPQLW